MKGIVLSYAVVYLLVTLLAACFSYFKSRKMNLLRFGLTLLVLLGLGVTLYAYAISYHDWQILAFALGFTGISTLFLYNGLEDGRRFEIVMLMSAGRFLLHLQLAILLYLFR